MEKEEQMTCPLCDLPNARIEEHSFMRCSETGYVDGGDLLVCECGIWSTEEIEQFLKREEIWEQ